MSTSDTIYQTSSSRQQPQYPPGDQFELGTDLIEYLRDYAREKPEVAALWCFAIGFVLGWKLKPW